MFLSGFSQPLDEEFQHRTRQRAQCLELFLEIVAQNANAHGRAACDGRYGAWFVVDPLTPRRARCEDARGWPLDCGHFLPKEKPEETLQEILSFLVEDQRPD